METPATNTTVTKKEAKGFTKNAFQPPYKQVILFPNDPFYLPTKGEVIGEEICNVFGTKRFLIKYTEPVIRKVANRQEFWPGGVVCVKERDFTLLD